VIRELVDRFDSHRETYRGGLDSHRETYRGGQYNEAQLREEFLNPFFEALGWDVYNRKEKLI